MSFLARSTVSKIDPHRIICAEPKETQQRGVVLLGLEKEPAINIISNYSNQNLHRKHYVDAV